MCALTRLIVNLMYLLSIVMFCVCLICCVCVFEYSGDTHTHVLLSCCLCTVCVPIIHYLFVPGSWFQGRCVSGREAVATHCWQEEGLQPPEQDDGETSQSGIICLLAL